MRRPDSRDAGYIGTEETQPEGSRIRGELGDRPERGQGLDKWGAGLRGRGSG